MAALCFYDFGLIKGHRTPFKNHQKLGSGAFPPPQNSFKLHLKTVFVQIEDQRQWWKTAINSRGEELTCRHADKLFSCSNICMQCMNHSLFWEHFAYLHVQTSRLRHESPSHSFIQFVLTCLIYVKWMLNRPRRLSEMEGTRTRNCDDSAPDRVMFRIPRACSRGY